MKKFYSLLSALIFLEIINLAFKIFNPYYFNVSLLVGSILVVAWMGWEAQVNRVVVVTLTALALLLTGTLFFVIWN